MTKRATCRSMYRRRTCRVPRHRRSSVASGARRGAVRSGSSRRGRSRSGPRVVHCMWNRRSMRGASTARDPPSRRTRTFPRRSCSRHTEREQTQLEFSAHRSDLGNRSGRGTYMVTTAGQAIPRQRFHRPPPQGFFLPLDTEHVKLLLLLLAEGLTVTHLGTTRPF